MKEYDEVYQQVVEFYDDLDLQHWYMMHRAGLVHLVATHFSIPESIINCIITEARGPAPLDHAEMDAIRDTDNDAKRA